MLGREVLLHICTSALRNPLHVSSSITRSLHLGTVLYRQRIRVVASGVSKPSGGKRIHASLDESKRKNWLNATEKEKSLRGRFPTDNVFLASNYAPELFSVSQAIDIYREMASPEMLDHVDGELHLHVQTNMRTGKSTKFVLGVGATVQVPHRPNFLQPRKIIVFTAGQAEAEAAKAAGALDAGAETLVAQMEHGLYHWESYDNVVCHKDFLPKLASIRKLLRERYPVGDRLGYNIMEMLQQHAQGIVITSSKDTVIPEVAHIHLPLGCLNDPKEHLEENLRTYIENINHLRSTRITGKFIEKMELNAPPSPLFLRLELYPEPEVKRPQKKSKGSKKDTDTIEGETKDTVIDGSMKEVSKDTDIVK